MSDEQHNPWWKAILPTNWRSIVAWVLIATVTTVVNFVRKQDGQDPLPIPPAPAPIWPDGWIAPTPDEQIERLKELRASQGYALFSETEAGNADIDPPGEDAFLWKYVIKVRGNHIPARDQGSIGTCVSFGFGTGYEYVMCVQIAMRRGPPQEAVDVATEVIYGGSRVDIHPNQRKPADLRGDGSLGSWAAKWLTNGGVLARRVYGNHDLTSYSVSRARDWGERGVPQELEPEAKKNLVGRCALIKDVGECRKAIQQGYAVAVCSNVGFENAGPYRGKRDDEGFIKPQGRWGHCMVLIGVKGGARPGFYCMNSWGSDWVSGPMGVGDPPPGGFWIDDAVVDRMLKQLDTPSQMRAPDSFAISDARGFPRRKLKPEDWIVQR